MTIIEKTGWYISSQQFNQYRGWETVMVYMHSDREISIEGAWWHQKGEEVNAIIDYDSTQETYRSINNAPWQLA